MKGKDIHPPLPCNMSNTNTVCLCCTKRDEKESLMPTLKQTRTSAELAKYRAAAIATLQCERERESKRLSEKQTEKYKGKEREREQLKAIICHGKRPLLMCFR
jgi:diphthamide synthase (EF-2-diphthine--ammonia ligase)